MTTAYFTGDGRYYAVLATSRSGFTIYGSLTAYNESSAYPAWETGTPQAYWAHVAGTNWNDDKWTYDFRVNNPITVWSRSKTVSSPGTYTVGGWANMADGKGRAHPANMSVTVPPNAPAAPSTPTVTRTNDGQQVVSWTRNASAAAPYSSQQVLRSEFTGGAWSSWTAVVTLNTTVTNSASQSVDDKTTVANRQYRYAIKAVNSANEAQSGSSASVFTTPTAASSLTATKIGESEIVLEWTNAVPHSSFQTILEYSTDSGATWVSLATVGPSLETYSWPSLPIGSSVVFRTRTQVVSAGNQGDGLLSTTWRTSNSVQLTAPPLPPSSLSPNGVAFDAAQSRTFTWQHNTQDSSSQTAYELRYRIGSAAWTTTGKVTSATSQRAFPASTFTNGQDYTWDVRTWGIHADPSDWSATATFTASAAPSVNITSPGATLGAAGVTAVWTFSDPEGSQQSLWEATLLRAGTTLESRSGSGHTLSTVFTTRLDDATQYQLLVRGRDGAGLWSAWAQHTFTTDFPVPNVPVVDITWNEENGSVVFQVTNPAGGLTVEYNEILISLDNGNSWDVAGTAPVNGTGFDYQVQMSTPVQYKVISWSNLPSFSESIVHDFDTRYTQWEYQATNLFTNPNLVGDGTWAEVARFATGSTPPTFAQPEDFRVRDLGTGESVMEIERVRGLTTTTRCIAGVSTKGGKPAVRMIPTDAANPLSYFNFAMPVAAQSGGTLLGTAHIDAPLTGVLDSSTKRIRSYFPIEVSEAVPNIAGSYPQRLVYSSRTTGAIIQYWHGGTKGSGDVWWTDIGLFSGEYDGPAFPQDWDRTVDRYVTTPEGYTEWYTRYRRPARGGYWGVGVDYSMVQPMHHNQGTSNPPAVDMETGLQAKVLHYFSGRTLPVETSGEALLNTGAVEFVVTSVAERDAIRAMANQKAPHLFRTPDGTKVYASISRVKDTRLAEGWYLITLTITEVAP